MKNLIDKTPEENVLGIHKLKSILKLIDKKNVKRIVNLRGLIVQIILAEKQTKTNYPMIDKGTYCIYYYNDFILAFLKLLREHGLIFNYYKIPETLFADYINTNSAFKSRLVIIYFNFDAHAWGNSLRIIKLISLPSKIISTTWNDLHKVTRVQKDDSKLYIVSTTKGLMTHLQAQKEKVGGKILCIIK